MTFVTVHILRALPMHNLNRDQNGLPKSQFDGGIQRGRLSSQSIKRPARSAFREAVAAIAHAPASVRTMDSNAVKHVVVLAERYATEQGKSLDTTAARKSATSIVSSLAKSVASPKDAQPNEGNATEQVTAQAAKKDNILLFSDAELEMLAQALVDEQNTGDAANLDTFIQDFASPSLDIAAFGRMFAAQASKSTQAAVAVSHAVMTHAMSLTLDYFTAVDEADDDRNDSGAAHIDSSYFTSGVYYSTFTIDPAQLVRSWTGIGSDTAQEQVQALVKALVEALPSGRITNSNPYTKPFLVLVEEQKSRTVYEFETPVDASENGGFTIPSIHAFNTQYLDARAFDPSNFVSSAALVAPSVHEAFGDQVLLPSATVLETIDDVASHVARLVFGALGTGLA